MRMPNTIRHFVFALFLLFNTLALFVAITYGSFLGFNFSSIWVASFSILVAAPLIYWITALAKTRLYELTSHLRFLSLVLVSTAFRVPFLLNPNPVVPEEFAILVRVMPMNPIGRLPWFFHNYDTLLGGMSVHPPISFLLGNVGYLLSPDIVGLRLVPFALSVITVFAVYLIASHFSEEAAYPCALLYAANPMAIMFTVVGYTDAYLLSFGLFGLALFIRALKSGRISTALLSGFLIGLSLLSKSTVSYMWVFLVVVFSLSSSPFVGKQPRALIMRQTCLTILAAIVAILPWAILDYQSFLKTYVSSPQTLLSGYFKFDLGISNPTLTSDTSYVDPLVEPLVGPLGKIFPKYVSTFTANASFVELLTRLILFLTPPIVMTAIAGLLRSSLSTTEKRDEFRKKLLLGIWIFVPLIALLAVVRDVRYFIPGLLPVLILCVYSMRKLKGRVGAGYKVSLSVVMLIFLMISWSVANQSYAGISEIRDKVQQYDIPHNSILTNLRVVSSIFNESIVHVANDSNITGLDAMISLQRYDCIIVLHHNRGLAYQFSDEAMEVFQRHYRNRLSFGSSFSYVEIFYD